MQFTNMELVLNKYQGAPYTNGCVLQRKKVDQGHPYTNGCTLSKKVDQGAPYTNGCTVSYKVPGIGLGRDTSCTVSYA